jgi:hypothetical protein
MIHLNFSELNTTAAHLREEIKRPKIGDPQNPQFLKTVHELDGWSRHPKSEVHLF